jgi:hypothetical protein
MSDQKENIERSFRYMCQNMKDGMATAKSVASFINKFNNNLKVESEGAELRLCVKFSDASSEEVILDELINLLPKKQNNPQQDIQNSSAEGKIEGMIK